MGAYETHKESFGLWEQEFRDGFTPRLGRTDEQLAFAEQAAEMKLLSYDVRFLELQIDRLGLRDGPQYHTLPIDAATELVVATESRQIRHGKSLLDVVRVIVNYQVTRSAHDMIVDADDFWLGLNTHTVAVTAGRIELRNDKWMLPSKCPPLIYAGEEGDTMSAYAGATYKPPVPHFVHGESTFDELNAQRREVALLEGVLAQLGPVSHEPATRFVG
jgi:hypothetical protein